MQTCKSFKTYKAEQPPKCNGGRGCDACRAKYEAVHRARARKNERMRQDRTAMAQR